VPAVSDAVAPEDVGTVSALSVGETLPEVVDGVWFEVRPLMAGVAASKVPPPLLAGVVFATLPSVSGVAAFEAPGAVSGPDRLDVVSWVGAWESFSSVSSRAFAIPWVVSTSVGSPIEVLVSSSVRADLVGSRTVIGMIASVADVSVSLYGTESGGALAVGRT
jgi:hypothetical protein